MSSGRDASGLRSGWVVGSLLLVFGAISVPAQEDPGSGRLLVRDGDRVAWIGSSSTKIGVWPRTVEFLLRTRHPELDLSFQRFTTGGGTFATGLEHLEEWLAEFDPTLVVFNYGGNDAKAGREGLPEFLRNMEQCVAMAEQSGARVILVTPQAADVRKSGVEPAALRTLYAETMLEHGRELGWTVVDTHHPLDLMQRLGEQADPDYTMLKDKIHLTDPGYVGWGLLFYDRLDLPLERSEAALTASGEVTAAENCEVVDVKTGEGFLEFTRRDLVLPVLPPVELPPRLAVPLEAHSRYLLAVAGLQAGEYTIQVEGKPVGVATAEALAAGVNLNTLLPDSGQDAPWEEASRQVWEGEKLGVVGQTSWRFQVRKQ